MVYNPAKTERQMTIELCVPFTRNQDDGAGTRWTNPPHNPGHPSLGTDGVQSSQDRTSDDYRIMCTIHAEPRRRGRYSVDESAPQSWSSLSRKGWCTIQPRPNV